jgi:hypothetical protein
MLMDMFIFWAVAGIGALTLIGVFYRMKDGFGPFNLRVVGLVLVATFATLLALKDAGALTAAVGVLGTIAGYLFGKDNVPNK